MPNLTQQEQSELEAIFGGAKQTAQPQLGQQQPSQPIQTGASGSFDDGSDNRELEEIFGKSSQQFQQEAQDQREEDQLGFVGGTIRGIGRIPKNFMDNYNRGQEETIERERGTLMELKAREARTPEIEEGITPDRLGTGLKVAGGTILGTSASLLGGAGASLMGVAEPGIKAIPGGETALEGIGSLFEMLGSAKDSVKSVVSPEAGRDIERFIDVLDIGSAIYGGALTKKVVGKVKPKVKSFVAEAGEATGKSIKSKALKSGISQDVVNAITSAPDKLKGEFLDMAKKAKANVGKLVPDKLTGSAGEELVTFVDELFGKKKTVGKELGAANKAAVKQKISLVPQKKKFLSDIGEMGVKVDGKGRLNFDASPRLRGNAAAQKLVNEMYSDLKKGTTTAGNLTEVRGGMFERLGGAKAQQIIGSKDKITSILNKTYKDLGKLMPENVQKLNQQFAELAGATDELAKKLKVEVSDLEDFIGKKTNKAAELARRLTSQSSSDLESLISKSSEIAKKHGIKAPSTLKEKIAFAQKAETLTKGVAPTSFKGNIDAAFKQLGSQVEKKGVIGGTVAGAYDTLKKILGSGKQAEIDAIIDLLEGKVKPSLTSKVIEGADKIARDKRGIINPGAIADDLGIKREMDTGEFFKELSSPKVSKKVAAQRELLKKFGLVDKDGVLNTQAIKNKIADLEDIKKNNPDVFNARRANDLKELKKLTK